MKKIVILFIILLFGICAFFGFKAAAKILPNDNQNLENSSGILQQNYLLIQVNDRTINDPILISVWVVFIYQSEPPQLMFMPLYPAFDADIQTHLDQSFTIDSDGNLDQKFVSQIEKSFDIQIFGYVLSDDVGVGYSSQWLTGQETLINSVAAVTDEEKLTQRMIAQTNYQQFCQLVSTNSANSFFSYINWTLLLPDHFSTNIPFENIALSIDQITRATTPVKCDVLSSE